MKLLSNNIVAAGSCFSYERTNHQQEKWAAKSAFDFPDACEENMYSVTNFMSTRRCALHVYA